MFVLFGVSEHQFSLFLSVSVCVVCFTDKNNFILYFIQSSHRISKSFFQTWKGLEIPVRVCKKSGLSGSSLQGAAKFVHVQFELHEF